MVLPFHKNVDWALSVHHSLQAIRDGEYVHIFTTDVMI